MKKIKITETQKAMLDKHGAKLTEMDIRPSQSPSKKVTDTFKQETKGLGIKVENVEAQVQWRDLIPNVHALLKQMYTNPSKEGMSPFWENVGLSWDEIIQMLTAVGLIKSVKGGYRLTKVVESPAKAVKIVAKLIEKMINDKAKPMGEDVDMSRDMSQDELFKAQVEDWMGKFTHPRIELLYNQGKYKEAWLTLRKISEPTRKPQIGEADWFDYLPDHPANQPDRQERKGARPTASPFDLIWTDSSEFAFFKKDGKLYVFYIDSADESEYEEIARDLGYSEESPVGRDEDGFMDVEYGEWDMNDDIISTYVNSNYNDLSFGVGLDDYENGTEMTEVTPELAKDLLGIAKYIKDPKSAEQFTKILSSVSMEETTTTAAMGDVPVGRMGVINRRPLHKSNVEDEMERISEHDPEQAPYMEQLKSLFNDGNVTPEQWLSYADDLEPIIKGLMPNENYHSIVSAAVGMLQFAEMAQQLGVDNDDAAMGTQSGVQMRYGFDDMKRKLAFEINHEETLPVEEATTTTSVGGADGYFGFDVPVGDGSDFWHAGNKMNKKGPANEMVAREGKDAKTDTQWPGGHFVEFDDCTKYNNNKKAQNGGCSVGAVDNVVKTKSSKNSVISDASIYEEVAKATGKSIEEVKSIIDSKINKSS